MLWSLKKLFAKYGLSPEPYIVTSMKGVETRKIFSKEMAAPSVRRTDNRQTMSAGLDPVPTSPVHTKQLVENV